MTSCGFSCKNFSKLFGGGGSVSDHAYHAVVASIMLASASFGFIRSLVYYFALVAVGAGVFCDIPRSVCSRALGTGGVEKAEVGSILQQGKGSSGSTCKGARQYLSRFRSVFLARVCVNVLRLLVMFCLDSLCRR
jgi:hypothetical protein